MYTLKGIFPEPKKEHKKNFIRENMKQLKLIQKPPKETHYATKSAHQPTYPTTSLGQVKSSTSNRSSNLILSGVKSCAPNAHKKRQEIKIKKGDMAEFLKRKEMRQMKQQQQDEVEECNINSSESSGHLRDIGCQTYETELSQKLTGNTKLTILYPKEADTDAKIKASGDSGHHKSPLAQIHSPKTTGDDITDERNRSRINAILERKDRDPYLPSGYQKGVLPKYLREKKDQSAKEVDGVKNDDDQVTCPPGHVTLPDNERKETLRMLRNSFAELVSELNKMPVKTDTLRMRNRKMELEKQLAKLEEGIKVFSRPKVFVKIGE